MTPAPTCVIYNPAAGRGRAERLLREVRTGVELRPTREPGHAEELARRAAEEGFAKVVAAGGDGTVHEVANGLLTAARNDSVFSVWPVGSANDYAHTLGLTAWWQRRAENPPTDTLLADVGRISGGGRERFYVNCLGVGFSARVTAEARKIRLLRGLPLYLLAFLRTMARRYATPRVTAHFDEQRFDGPTLQTTLNLAQREGGFPVTPAARLTDGLFDFLHATNLRRHHLLRFLPSLIAGSLPTDDPRLKFGRCRRAVLTSADPLCVHADGEFFTSPDNEVRELTVEVVPSRLRVEVYSPALYGSRVSTG